MIKYIKVFDGDNWNYWKVYENQGRCVLMEDITELEYYDMSDVTTKLRTRTVEEYLKSKYKDVYERQSEWAFSFTAVNLQNR